MLKCAICFEKPVRPHVTVCGHVFCYDHIRKWLSSSSSGGGSGSSSTSSSCPVCRRKFNSGNKGGLIEIFDTAPSSTNDPGTNAGTEAASASGTVGSALFGSGNEAGVGQVLDTLREKWDDLLLEKTRLQVTVRKLEEEVKQLRKQRCLEPELSQTSLGWEKDDPLEASLQNGAQLERTSANGEWGEPCSVEIELVCSNPWKLDYEISVHSGPVHGIDINSRLGLVASASWDRTCNLFDVKRKVTVGQLKGVHEKGLYGVAFSKTQDHIIGTCSSDHTCNIWNVLSGSCLCRLEDHEDEVNGLSFHHSRNLIATASDDRCIIVWDVAVGERLMHLVGHRNCVYDVCFSPTSSLLASGSFDWNTKLWDIRMAKEIRSLEGHTDDVIGVDISSSGHLIATGSDDCTCRVTDMRMWETVAVLDGGQEVKRVKFSPYTKALATTSADGRAMLWGTEFWNRFDTLDCNPDNEFEHCFDVCWQEDAEFLVTASHDGQWRYWIPDV